MSNRIAAKHKVDRRYGVNLWGVPKSPVNLRNYRPGQHGKSFMYKPTDYGIQLAAKQKLKLYYGNISEKKFISYYKKASAMKGDTAERLIGLLESRLDSVLYRAKLASTVFFARQLVSHGHVKVNGKRVTVASYQVKENDKVELNDIMKTNVTVLTAIADGSRTIPGYIELDDNKKSALFVRVPALEEVPYPIKMEPNVVIEFYSR